MNIIGKVAYFLFLLFLSVSCNKSADKSAGLKKVSLRVLDTIKVKYNGETLLLSEARNNKLLLFDFFSRDILITDLKGSVISQFNGSFIGKEHTGDKIYGVHFQNDSLISILTEKGYFIYDLNWKLKEKYLHPFSTDIVYITGDFKLSFDEKRKRLIALLKMATDLKINNRDFYDQARHLTIFNVDSQTYQFKIKYEPEGSYLQRDYFTNEFGVYFDIDKDTLAVIYPRDPIVYIYGLSDFKKIKTFNTQPDFERHEVKFKFGQIVDQKSRLTSFANSCYNKIFSRSDTILTSYQAGMPKESLENINNVEEFNNMAFKNMHYYMQFFVKGKKTAEDFELPKEFPFLSVYSGGRVMLSEQRKWLNKHDGYKRYLLGKIEFTEPESEKGK